MKRDVFGFIALLILAACGNSKPPVATDENSESTDTINVEEPQEQPSKYDSADAKSFGLNGMVKNVEYQIYSTYEEDGKINQGSLYERGDIAFDKYGHILVDEWLNEYGYDAEGNFYRGTHLYTKIQRDKDGRLSKYADVDPTGKSEVYNTYVFKYDKNGRLSSVNLKGWTVEWTEKRFYKGGNIYPESVIRVGTIKGNGSFSSSQNYVYQHFDTIGNWTERTIVQSDAGGEVVADSVALNESQQVREQKVQEQIKIEKRIITYYE